MPLTADEEAAVATMRATVHARIADLRTLDPDGYFEVEGWGRIRVGELISLLTLADFTIHPQSAWHPTPPPPTSSVVNGSVDRNGGNPEVRINRELMLSMVNSPDWLDFFIFHELSHATRRGWDHRGEDSYELRTNDVAAAIIGLLGRPVRQHGSALTPIQYFPGTPGT